jgi:hypothetical protein
LSALLAAAGVLALAQALLPGTYTNEEQVYFAREAGAPEPVWAGLAIAPEGDGFRLTSFDPYGAPGPEDQRMTLVPEGERLAITTGRCTRRYAPRDGALEAVEARGSCRGPAAFHRFTSSGMLLRLADGGELELRRARPFTCWAAIPRRVPRPDGTTDWWGARNLAMHDQGGRVRLETDEPEPQRFELRMRHVVWPSGPNQPSLVLYVFEPNGERAISYSWASPEASRVGINIRTLQASCAIAG